jgi:hypothetical protein
MALRDEDPPNDTIIIVRGGLLEAHAVRKTTNDCLRDFGFIGLSVFAAIDMTMDDLCRTNDALSRPGKIRTTTFGDLRRSSFPVLPTFQRPHYSVILADQENGTIERLIGCFSAPLDNPAKMIGDSH